MADPQTRASAPPKGKGKDFLGQPTWVWVVGAVVVVGGYLYLRSKSKSSTSGQGSGSGGGQRPQGGPGGWSTQTFKIWVKDHHGRPAGHPEDRWISHGH